MWLICVTGLASHNRVQLYHPAGSGKRTNPCVQSRPFPQTQLKTRKVERVDADEQCDEDDSAQKRDGKVIRPSFTEAPQTGSIYQVRASEQCAYVAACIIAIAPPKRLVLKSNKLSNNVSGVAQCHANARSGSFAGLT